MSGSQSFDSRVFALADAQATEALGARVGAALSAGDCVCLWGELGAGKTTLARGAIAAWAGQDEDAPSPTFTLVQTYDGPRGNLWHCDLYRLKSAQEALEIGVVDALGVHACVIEWPERLGGETEFLPRDRLDIALEFDGAARRALVSGCGDWSGRVDAI